MSPQFARPDVGGFHGRMTADAPTEATKKDGLTRVAIILAYFGSDVDVRELREEDVVGYTRWRLAGGAQNGPATKNGRPTMSRCSPC
jgi:hypothetical protein